MTDTIKKTLFLNAPKERVWAYLTEAKKLGEWFHAAREDLSHGQPYEQVGRTEEKADETVVYGTVKVFKPHTKLALTFTHEWLAGAETLIEWELEESFGGTRLTMTHSGFDGSPNDTFMLLADHDKGWDDHFSRLRDVVKA